MLGMAERFSGEWRSVKLGDVVRGKLSYGINAAAVPYDGKNPAYIRITDITEYGRYNAAGKVSVIASTREREKYRLREGDIVLARTGSVGKSYLYDPKDGELIYAGYLIKASINCEKCDPRYVFYQLHTRRYWSWIATMSKRSVQSGINSKEYALFTFPLPPLDEQIAIADTLSAFDRHLANLSELIAKHEGIRAGALEDLLSGRTRLPGFSCEWRTVKLGEVVSVKRGKRVVRRDLSVRGKFPVFQNSLKPLGYFDRNNCPPESAFLIAGGNAGDAGFCDSAFWAADDCYYFVERESVHQKFLYYVLIRNHYYLHTQARRTTIPRLSHDIIESITIPLPPVDEQIAIAETLSALDLNITNLKAEHAKISSLRTAAINDLLTAKIRLPRPH